MQKELTTVLDMIERGQIHPIDAEDALLDGLNVEAPKLRARVLRHTAPLIDTEDLARRHLRIVQDEDCTPQERANAAIALGPYLEKCTWGDWDDPCVEPPVSKECFRALAEGLREVYQRPETSDRVEDVLLLLVLEPGELGELANLALRECKTYGAPDDIGF